METQDLIALLRSDEPLSPAARAWLADAFDPDAKSDWSATLTRRKRRGRPPKTRDIFGLNIREHRKLFEKMSERYQNAAKLENVLQEVSAETGVGRSTLIKIWKQWSDDDD